MGYSGLDSIGSSDKASDLFYTVTKKMIATLKKGLKEKSNTYNTSGIVNVALIFEEFLLPVVDSINFCDEFTELAQETLTLLEEERNDAKNIEWDNEYNKDYHLNAYKRLIQSLREFIESNS